MNLLLCLIVIAGLSTAEDLSLKPAQPVAGAALEITLPSDVKAGSLNLCSPFGIWRKTYDIAETRGRVSLVLPEDLPVLLIGVVGKDDLEVPHEVYKLIRPDGSPQSRSEFWSAYLLGAFPSPFPAKNPDLGKALESAQAAVAADPSDIVAVELLWRLQAKKAQEQGDTIELLREVDSKLKSESDGRLALAALRTHVILKDSSGAKAISGTYKEQISAVQASEGKRWDDILNTPNYAQRARKIHEWLAVDPLSDFAPQCLQILAATYSDLKDYRLTALFGMLSLQVTPEDAMTLNGVAYAFAQGGFQLQRGLMLVDKALAILKNPRRLSKPPGLSDTQWQRELKHATSASLDTRGWLLTGLERWDDAKRAFDEAISLERSDEYYYHYGLMLKRQGKNEEARKILEEGLKYSGRMRLDIKMVLDDLEH